MKTHKIKLLLNFCDDVLSGDKRFENGWGLKDGYVVFGIKEVKNDL
jgi:hypothetical protein